VFRIVLNSRVLTTWLALSIRLGGAILVIPLALRHFHPSDTALWLLFSTVAGLQLLLDFGFGQTFSRFVAFAQAGKAVQDMPSAPVEDVESVEQLTSSNPESLAVISSVMGRVYRYLTATTLLLLASVGTWAVAGPINRATSPNEAWIAWACVVISTTLSVHGNKYVAQLNGADFIALQKRWDALMGGGLFLSQLMVLFMQGSLLGLVAVSQAWVGISFVVNKWLCERNLPESTTMQPSKMQMENLFHLAWSSAWRSAVGVGLGFGVMQISSVVFANILPSVQAASFLLGLRIMQVLNQFSQVPFYARLPILAGYRAKNQIRALEDLATTAMQHSYWVYVIGFGVLGLLGPWAFEIVESRTQFPSGLFWAILGAGTLVERFGAMHLQLFSTTNRIVWHKANGIFSIGFVSLLLSFASSLAELAYPVALLGANIGLYAPYSASHSYSSIHIDRKTFEKRAVLMPAMCFVPIFLILILVQR